jgi:hypothetical protein
MTDTAEKSSESVTLGHKCCSESYKRIVDLTGYVECPECGGDWR